MANVWQQMGYPTANGQHITVADNFVPVANGAGTDLNTTESLAGMPVRTLGTYSNLYARITVSTGSGATTVTFRLASANGNQALSIASGATGEFTDAVNTDSPTAGQIIDIDFVGSAAGNYFYSVAACQFAPNSGTVSRLGAFGSSVAFSSTVFVQVIGGADPQATENNQRIELLHACTLQNLAVVCSTKNRSKADTVTLRKGGVNGNNTVSITGTGLFEDNTHTDSIASGNIVTYGITVGSGTGTDTIFSCFIEESSTDGAFTCGGGFSGGTPEGFGSTLFFTPGGYFQSDSTTESPAQFAIPFAATASQLFLNLVANTTVAATTLTLRKNAGSTALVISVSGSTSGLFTDTSDSVALASGDKICLQGAVPNNWTPGTFSFVVSLPPAFSPDEDFVRLAMQVPFDPVISVWQ